MAIESPLMISVSGVRGIVGQSLTADVVLRWAEAFGSLCRPGPVIVGGDSRGSKVMMRGAVFGGLAGSGCRIIDLGIVPTPTIGLAVKHYGARGGMAITASHNPAEWNALKFFGDDGLFLNEDDGNRLRALVEGPARFGVAAPEIGTYEKDELAVGRHRDVVLAMSYLNIEALRARRFRVGLDAVHGAGGTLLRTLLEELGCVVVGFHLEPTGAFPRNPEPTTEHLQAVGVAMQEAGVDIGFAVDPDADRMAVILETGVCAGEEATVTAATDTVLRRRNGPVVINCSTTRAVDDVAARYGATVYRTKVGEAHVARRMLETGAVIGGEGNGGVMLPAVHAARDTAVGCALMLQAVLNHGGTAADYFASLPQYQMIKRKITFDHPETLQRTLALIDERAPWGKADRLDGWKWNLPQGWVQARASNTEPIIRIFAEAVTAEEADELAQQLVTAVAV